MDTTWTIIIIVLVLGVVIGNITLLKYSAKFKFPTPTKSLETKQNGSSADNNNAVKKRNGYDDDDEW